MNQTQTSDMKDASGMQEQLSALADGQLQGEALAVAIDAVAGNAALRATWQTYHLVGDVLRTGTHTACSDQTLFISRLRSRLAQEASPVLPVVAAVEAVAPVAAASVEAANEAQFRWKMVAGFASVAAAAAIGWNLLGVPAPAAAPAQLAYQQPSAPAIALARQSVPAMTIAQPVQTVAAALPQSPLQPVANYTPTKVVIGNGSPQVMLRDPRLDQLLEAHQQAGGASLPSGFLRNATFERPSR